MTDDPYWDYGKLVMVGDTGIGLWIPLQHKVFGDYGDDETIATYQAIGLLVELGSKGGTSD